jgi:hypothetical protein
MSIAHSNRNVGPRRPAPGRGANSVTVEQGGLMYKKPRVERFGTFRELTRAGWDRDNDGLVVFGIGGDNLCGAPNRPECPWDGDINIGRS